jgi:hypothetical protein
MCVYIYALQRVSQELDYRIDICRVTKGAHIEHLYGRTETWSVSPSVDMFSFGVTIPATVPQGSEIPEGLMNNRVFMYYCSLNTMGMSHLKIPVCCQLVVHN